MKSDLLDSSFFIRTAHRELSRIRSSQRVGRTRRTAPSSSLLPGNPAPSWNSIAIFSLRQTFVPFALRPYDGFLHAGYCRLMIRCVASCRSALHLPGFLPRTAFRRGVLRSPPVSRSDRIRTARRSSSARNTPQPSLSPALCRFFRNSIYSLVVPCRFPTIRTAHPLPLSLLLLAAAPRRLRIRSRFFPPTSLRLLRPRAAKHPPAFRRA